MAFGFDGIRRRLQAWLDKAHSRALDAKIKLAKRNIVRQSAGDSVVAAELESIDQEARWRYRQLLYSHVGQALCVWSAMEDTLVAIASMLLRTDVTKSGLVMYSIINFSVWLNLIDELFPLEPAYMPLKPRWNKLNERLRALKDTRDRLAHHIAHTRDDIDFPEDSTSLRPGRYDTRRKSQKYQPLTRKQIEAFTGAVAEVNEDLGALITAMAALVERGTSPQKSSEQDSGQHPP